MHDIIIIECLDWFPYKGGSVSRITFNKYIIEGLIPIPSWRMPSNFYSNRIRKDGGKDAIKGNIIYRKGYKK